MAPPTQISYKRGNIICSTFAKGSCTIAVHSTTINGHRITFLTPNRALSQI